jgi:D-3-phosphoglycerate dehydrogenase / 2-oxoglutarate reductase
MNLRDCRLLVTPTSYGKNDPSLRTELVALCGEVIFNDTGKLLRAGDVARLLPGVDGYIAGVDEINADALAAADRLKVIARYGVGVDQVDLEAAKARGIVVTNTPGANSVSVAELTIGMMLALARHIPEAVAATRGGTWPRVTGLSLRGKTVGLVGLGAVGREVAKRLASFECKLLAYDPYASPETARSLGVEMVGLPQLLASADFVSLHVPATPETRNMVNEESLAQMKRGAYLINTARGDLIDEDALARSLESGHLAGAALDVLRQEPPAPDHPLLALKQVLITAHSGAHADDAMNAMGRIAMADCLSVLQGQEPKYRVA